MRKALREVLDELQYIVDIVYLYDFATTKGLLTYLSSEIGSASGLVYPVLGVAVFLSLMWGAYRLISGLAKRAGWNLPILPTFRKPKPTIPPGIIDDSVWIGQLLASFEKAFEEVKLARSVDATILRLGVLRNKLHDLCYGPMGQARPDWNNRIRGAIKRLLEWLAEEFDDRLYQDRYLDLLSLIVIENDDETIGTAKELFLKKVEDIYHDPEFGADSRMVGDRFVLPILQRLHNHELVYMMGLVNDAFDKWTEQQFQTFNSHLELDLMDKSKGDYDKLRRYLSERQDKAGEAKDDLKARRASTLLIHMPL